MASKVAITTQPSATVSSGVAFAQQPVVQLRDASNNAVAQSDVVVTAAIASGGGTLGGSTTATTSANGTATFSGLSITGTTGTRTLSFSSGSLAAATSAVINVDVAASTTPPPPPQPSSGTPWLLEDFSTYTSTANMLSNPRGIYSTGEDEAPNAIQLDNSGPPSGGKSMRYDYTDRTSQGGSGTTGRCGSYTIGRNINLPASVKDVWIEMYVKFTTNFTTAAPTSWGCTSGAGLKLMFGRVTPSSRFDIGQIDIAGNNTAGTWHGGWPGNEDAVSRTYASTVQPYDGNWHRIRLHLKASTNGSDGAYEFWIDNVLINRSLNISTGSGTQIYSIALTRNINQGPDHAQSLWWGGIRAYNTNPGW